MNQPDRFGPFLLFQETESNLYRSCYRAGVTRGRAVERIIRLEVFDRPDFDPAELSSHLEFSAQIQASLQDPHIATGAGLGRVDGIPYTAYDFELGTTLAAFSQAARKRSFPIPLDQALFISERVALALAAAYRVENDGRPSLHSFLTPDSVLLSNVGEVKVCGFEIAPSLRLQLHGQPHCAPYLSPECRSGRPRQPQDDVFSLGSLLYELVTGKPLSTESPELDSVIVEATGEPAPKGLQSLLESSLAPPGRRIPHVLDWQRSLGKMILDGEYNPTTFNLAFLLHTLLREPLEQGVENLEREKRFVLPRDNRSTEVDSTVEVERPGQTIEVSSEREDRAAPAQVGPGEVNVPSPDDLPPSLSIPDRKPFWLGFSISAITASALLGGVLVLGGRSEPVPPASLAPLTPVEIENAAPRRRAEMVTASTPASWAEIDSGNPAESLFAAGRPAVVLTEVVQGQLGTEVVQGPLGRERDDDEIQRTVDERTAEIERNLAAEYDAKLEALRSEMVAMRELDGRVVQAAPERQTTGIDDEPVEAGPGESPEPFAQPPETARRPQSNEPSQEARQARIEPPRQAFDTPATKLPSQGERQKADPAESSVPSEKTPATVLSSLQAPEPEPAVAPSPRLDPGQPAASSAGLQAPVETPAQLIRLNPPLYPPAAKRLGLSATAQVKVMISSGGEVREAEILGPEIGSGFDRAALAAVRRSKWKPALRDGEPVDSTSVITVQFRP